MKIIPYFYYTLSLITFGGSFVLMANSTSPLYFAGLGIIGTIIFASIGALTQVIIYTANTVKRIAETTEFHTKALKHLTNKSDRKG